MGSECAEYAIEEVIIQAGGGYDISCGVVYLRVSDLHAGDVAGWGMRARWIDEVELRIAAGISSRRPKHMSRFADRKVEDIFRYDAKAIRVRSDVCERQYIPVDESRWDTGRIARARDQGRAAARLGRRRKSLRRNAGRRRRRVGLGDNPLRQPRLPGEARTDSTRSRRYGTAAAA